MVDLTPAAESVRSGEWGAKTNNPYSRIEARSAGVWCLGRQDVEDYIEGAYRHTGERIAAGSFRGTGSLRTRSS